MKKYFTIFLKNNIKESNYKSLINNVLYRRFFAFILLITLFSNHVFAYSTTIKKGNLFHFVRPLGMGQLQDYYHIIACDTILGGVFYHKIMSCNATGAQQNYQGLIREDTLKGKIYFRSDTCQTEKLIVNYNLKVGDSFFFPFYKITKKVTQVQIENKYGQLRKVIYFDDALQFIEGIGFTFWGVLPSQNYDFFYAYVKSKTKIVLKCKPNEPNFKSIFGKKSTSWSLVRTTACDATSSRIVSIQKDTIFNSHDYKKLEKYGYLREDTINGKVWFWDISKKKEYLVMDLNLDVGDFFDLIDYKGGVKPIKVLSVDWVNNLKTIRLDVEIRHCVFTANTDYLTFVEGSGPSASFDYQQSFYDDNLDKYMACHFKDGVKVLGNVVYKDNCYFNYISTKEIYNDETIKMYFQGEKLKIEAESLANDAKIVFFDVVGNTIYQQNINALFSEIILPELANGVYIAVLFQKEMPSKYLKFVR